MTNRVARGVAESELGGGARANLLHTKPATEPGTGSAPLPDHGSPIPPFPAGWYAVAFSGELARGTVMPVTLAGRDLVLYRTASGSPAAMHAHCPHLGAHLGYGGTVDGESLRCPFHGFRFAADGSCVSTPYRQSAPPRLAASAVSVQEIHGAILAWHSPLNRPPGWRVPEVAMSGWPPWTTRQWTITGHPQETTENSVDLGHFSQLHSFRNVAITDPCFLDGPHLSIGYSAVRRLGPARNVGMHIRISVHGLGHSYVEADLPGIRVRQLVLASPLDGRQIVFRIAMSVRLRHGGSFGGKALESFVARIAMRQFARDVQQDFPVWEHKIYVDPPRLAGGDGPIGPYRRWAQQFYGETDAADRQ